MYYMTCQCFGPGISIQGGDSIPYHIFFTKFFSYEQNNEATSFSAYGGAVR